MIELKNLNKSYVVNTDVLHALKNINLQVQAGEIFGVIGKSGAGKSTLIRCVNLLERPDTGQVIIAGTDLTQLSAQALRAKRRKIGMIFQQFNLLANRTVYQNIALPLELIGYTKQKIEQAVVPLLELTGLSEKRNAYPAQLSGGQKQRVAIARALVCQPEVLLCDEATSALDLQTTKAILALLKDINKKLGLTILLITHEMDVIKEITDRVALLDHGAIIEQAATTDFFVNPQTSIAQQLVVSCLKQDPPATLLTRLTTETEGKNAVLRILYHGKAADEPLISQLIHHFDINLNILQANIELLKNTTLGVMITEVIGNHSNLKPAIAYLEKLGVQVEVIGYVN